MYTTRDLIELVRKKNGNCSDYRLHKILDCNKTTISNYVNGKSTLSDRIAVNVAVELNLSRAYVVACANAERHIGEESYPVWQSICRQLDPGRHAA